MLSATLRRPLAAVFRPPPHDHAGREPLLALGGRLLLSLVFLAGAAFNVLVTLRHPESLRGFADLAILHVLRLLILEWVIPYATLLVVLLIAFEVMVGVLLLARGTAVRLGLLAAVAFFVALVPVVREYGVANLPFFLVALVLLRREYPTSVFRELRVRLRRAG
jgi:hypothetical protein